MNRVVTAVCAAILGVVTGHSAYAGPADLTREFGVRLAPPHMSEGRRTTAPFAYTRFCVLNPSDCGRNQLEVVERLSIWRLVVSTNRRVNRSMVARNDGRERWSVGGKSGDCEDFALTKRQELIRKGVPASALRMATATTPQGEGHAVLILTTASGDFVLDNRYDRIVQWHQSGLQWLKIASAEDPRVWHSISQ